MQMSGFSNVEMSAPDAHSGAMVGTVVDRWLDCRKRLGLTGRHPLFCTALEGEPLWDRCSADGDAVRRFPCRSTCRPPR